MIRLLLLCVAVSVQPVLANANDDLRQIQLLALAHIGGALCAPGERCTPATEAELVNPPLKDASVQQVVTAAVLSTMSENCGHGHSAVFLPFMAKQRASGVYSDRQLALMGLVHGVGMSMFEDDPRAACSDKARALLARNGVK